MANLKGVVQLTEGQYNVLKTNGSITVNGTTITFDENTIYVTLDGEGDTRGDFISLSQSIDVTLSTSDFAQIYLDEENSNIHFNSLIFDDNASKVTIGAGVSYVKVTSIIQFNSNSLTSIYGNRVQVGNNVPVGAEIYQYANANTPGGSLADRKVVLSNVCVLPVAQGDEIKFFASSSNTGSPSDDVVSQSHFIVEVLL